MSFGYDGIFIILFSLSRILYFTNIDMEPALFTQISCHLGILISLQCLTSVAINFYPPNKIAIFYPTKGKNKTCEK